MAKHDCRDCYNYSSFGTCKLKNIPIPPDGKMDCDSFDDETEDTLYFLMAQERGEF